MNSAFQTSNTAHRRIDRAKDVGSHCLACGNAMEARHAKD